MAIKIRAAICGGSESGKTFLTSGFTRGMWFRWQRRAIVFDPWVGETNWGPGAWPCKDFEAWKRVVTGSHGAVVVWDESTANGGRDYDNVPLFSEIRHRHPVLLCIGHRYSSILPTMRVNLTDLFLARSNAKDAEAWALDMADPEIMRATELDQYEFLHKRVFQPVRVLRYTKDQILSGILP